MKIFIIAVVLVVLTVLAIGSMNVTHDNSWNQTVVNTVSYFYK